MRILLYSEIVLPDSPSLSDQPKTRSEDNLSEKENPEKTCCLELFIVLIWFVLLPSIACFGPFFIERNVLLMKRCTSRRTSQALSTCFKPHSVTILRNNTLFSASLPSHFIPFRKFNLCFFCSALIFWPLKNHMGGKNFFLSNTIQTASEKTYVWRDINVSNKRVAIQIRPP